MTTQTTRNRRVTRLKMRVSGSWVLMPQAITESAFGRIVLFRREGQDGLEQMHYKDFLKLPTYKVKHV